jgi:hypothetical protein
VAQTMSTFSGRQSPVGSEKIRGNKGVMRLHRERRYKEALERQVRNLDGRGKQPASTYAPLELFTKTVVSRGPTVLGYEEYDEG